jgi:3-hydroxyisobutyrate dehydrogenase-like beta-hydroxyacid dehydrogenase
LRYPSVWSRCIGGAGQIYVTAPVFGRPEAAAAAKLFIVAAGPMQAIEKCQPLFETMGQKIFVIGEKPSDANLVKLSGNFLIAATIESLGEAIALIRKSGIDAHRYVEILRISQTPHLVSAISFLCAYVLLFTNPAAAQTHAGKC